MIFHHFMNGVWGKEGGSHLSKLITQIQGLCQAQPGPLWQEVVRGALPLAEKRVLLPWGHLSITRCFRDQCPCVEWTVSSSLTILTRTE